VGSLDGCFYSVSTIFLDDISGLVDSNLPGIVSVFTYLKLRFVSVGHGGRTYNLVR